ncbi:HlyD family type I secretion periplasmic adaptor subunit [Legionella sp. CNM-4043-24]|uniref:HlyD family type I secretion periplasmic adaptor subunit n=1 Tax=Legionella sp. CNM-4043-24 TaxID=3421646 RepID=UPI00403AF7A9
MFFLPWKKKVNHNRLEAEDDEFVVDSKTALLDKTTPLANKILYTVLLFLLGSVLWAAFATIDEISVAEGKIIPSSQNKIIQSLDGGIVQEMLVHEGETVEKNQILLRLDVTRYAADYGQAKEKYYALLAMIARLKAETQDLDSINFPKEILPFSDLIARENKLFKTRKEALAADSAVLEKSYALANHEVEIMQPLVDKGYASRLELIRAQRDANDIKGKLQQLKSQFHEKALEELNQNSAELSSIIENLTALRDKMDDTVIASPVKGIIKKINVVTIGGVISPGMDIMEIVPIEDNLLFEAKIKPTDIAFIHPGQKASIKLTAYDYTVYGALHGQVESVSADSIENEKARPATGIPEIYYRVLIRAERNYLGSEHHKLMIIPGMSGTAHIVTGKKTVLTYLLKPFIKAKQEALRER